MDELHHECGVAALYYLPGRGDRSPVWTGDPDQVSRLMPRMLLDLQNRGQLAAGMATYNPDRDKLLDTYKDIGTVIEAFRINDPAKYASHHGGVRRPRRHRPRPLRHLRRDRAAATPSRSSGGTAASGSGSPSPSTASSPTSPNSATNSSHNHDYHLTRDNDTEVIMHYLAHELRGDDRPDLVEVFRNLAAEVRRGVQPRLPERDGRHGRPPRPARLPAAVLRHDGPLFAAASESVALQNLGFRNIQSLEPGRDDPHPGRRARRSTASPSRGAPSHCFFEWIYFANVASTLDDRSVYLSRSRLGQELAKQEKALDRVPLDPRDTIVVPVPDTGKAAADAMAFALGIPSVEGLIRNRYIGRTFIEGANRADKVRLKFTPLREVLSGKRVLLVEDSIVRSTTLKSLLHHLRDQGGAKEIHVRVACPPIVAPCFYGIDMTTVKRAVRAEVHGREGADRRGAGRDGQGTRRRQPVLPAAGRGRRAASTCRPSSSAGRA